MSAPSDGGALLEVDGLRKYFGFGGAMPWSGRKGEVRAVDGVSFDLRQGQTLSIVGESGSGKTTTAKLVLKLEQPDAGTIRFKGEDITRVRGAALRRYRSSVQAVFQDPWSSLDPRMRVRSIVAEPLLATTDLRGRRLHDRVAEVLEAVGLPPGSARDFPHEFSGGQRQRIAVARALAIQPDLIVLDEPVSALDVSIRAQIMNLLKDIQDRLGVAFLVIAHDLATVRYLSHKVAVMYLGEIVESASAERLFMRSGHPYTRALMSAGRPAKGDGDGSEIILRGEVPSAAHPPPGCRFHPRCWLYERLGSPERCHTEKPALRDAGGGDLAACHFSELIESPQAAPTPERTA